VKITKALRGYSGHYCTTPSVFFQANFLPSGEWLCRAVWNTNGAKERETHESISRLS
jgi:hypothetical protein